MSRPEATEFEVEIKPTLDGGWEWTLVAKGRFPDWLVGLKTHGETMTRWGARAEGRHCLKSIRRYQRIGGDTERVRV